MSCCVADGAIIKGRVARLELTVYTDAAQTTPEDLTDRLFSASVYHPETLEVYATAVGSGVDLVDAVNGRLDLIFAEDDFADVSADQALYIVDEITGGEALPFLPPDEILMTNAPPVVPTPP